MKFIKKDSDELILRKVLFLRYGTDDVEPTKPPIPLLKWSDVSRLLKIPYAKVMSLKRKFF